MQAAKKEEEEDEAFGAMSTIYQTKRQLRNSTSFLVTPT